MKKLNSILIAILILTLSFSCDDVFEEDISDDFIQIISPTSGTTIEGNTVNFSWQNLDGADDYRIQILNDNQITEVDSLISTTQFSYVIDPGTYQWRVRGENFAYETPYTFPADFSIIASDDLTNQNVVLLTPSVNFYTNNANIILTWNAITTADSYTIEIVKNLNGLQTVFQEANVTSSSFNLDASIFDEDAEYIWEVKAVNATSETANSERSIFVDRVNPNQPLLTSPLDFEILTSTTVNFNWTNGTDTGNIQSTIENTIEISIDVNFTTIIETAETANNSYQYTFSTIGIYYWRVKADDLATNTSDYSIVRTLDIQ